MLQCFPSCVCHRYRNVLSDLLVQIYHTIVKHVEVQLTPLVVAGILEYEPIPGMGGTSPAKRGGRGAGADAGRPTHTVDDLLKLFTKVMSVMRRMCVEPVLTRQVFKQLFYICNTLVVNNFLLRKDFCHCFKGVQVSVAHTRLHHNPSVP